MQKVLFEEKISIEEASRVKRIEILSKEYLDGKYINFTEVDEVDHNKDDMETFYKDKTMTISLCNEWDDSYIYITSSYFWRVKQSNFLIDGEWGPGTTVHGKCNVKYVESYNYKTDAEKQRDIFRNNHLMNFNSSFKVSDWFKEPESSLKSEKNEDWVFNFSYEEPVVFLSQKIETWLRKYLYNEWYKLKINLESWEWDEKIYKLFLYSDEEDKPQTIEIYWTGPDRKTVDAWLYIEFMRLVNISIEITD